MTNFIKNVKHYLKEMKIKQSYLSLITGMDKNKVSRILSGIQEESGSDMELIAKALGKKIEYFLAEDLLIQGIGDHSETRIAFYTGEPTCEQEKMAKLLIEFMENIDEILSADIRFKNLR